MNFERAQNAYRNAEPSMLGRGIEALTSPLSGVIAKAVPASLVEKIVLGIDAAASKPALTGFDHDRADMDACYAASRKVETRARVMNGASGLASGLGGALTMGADIPATIALSARNIRDTGRAYGYEGAGTAEQLFRLQILEIAALNDPEVRTRRIADLEADIAPDGSLLEGDTGSVAPLIDQAIERISRALAFRVARNKAGTLIPLLGSAVGGLVNASFQGDVSKAARFAFQARRLKGADQPV